MISFSPAAAPATLFRIGYSKINMRLMAALSVVIALLSMSLPSHSQILKTDIRLSELNWIDRKYFEKQRQVIDNLGRENYGTRVRGNEIDLTVLQRIIDGEHISKLDHAEQKAMGIVLGDIYVAEHGLQWREYNDEAGKSRAVCLPDTTHCLFPLSMITRRMKVTEAINIQRIYQRGVEMMAEVAPQLPYDYREEPARTSREDRLKYRHAIPYIQ